jgi:hypothetical protein
MKVVELNKREIALNLVSPIIVTAGTWGGIGKYGFMDDYAILESSISGEFNFQVYMSQGRPFSAIYSYFIFSFIDKIDALIYLHILGSLTLAFFSWLLFTYFRNIVENKFILVTLSTVPILVTPGLLLVSAWGVMSSIGISLFTSTIAAFLIRNSKSRINFLVVTLLCISFLSYPPSTTIFLTLPCIVWVLSITSLSRPDAHEKPMNGVKRSVVHIVFAGLTSLILLKIIASQYDQTNNRIDLIGDIPTKMNFLFKAAVPTAFDFFEPNQGFSNFGWLATVLISGIILCCKSKRQILEFFIVVLLGIGGTFAPIILTAENWASNRSLYASQWMIATLSLISLLLIIRISNMFSNKQVTLVISCLVLVGSSLYHSNNLLITTMKNPQLKELDLARSAVSKVDSSRVVEVKRSEWTDSLAPWVIGDEFGIPSTCQPWVPVPMVKLILKESKKVKDVDVVLVDQFKSSNSIDFSKLLNPK